MMFRRNGNRIGKALVLGVGALMAIGMGVGVGRVMLGEREFAGLEVGGVGGAVAVRLPLPESVYWGEKVVSRVGLRNSGKEAVKLTATASCTCSKVVVEPGVIEAGGVGELVVEVDSSKYDRRDDVKELNVAMKAEAGGRESSSRSYLVSGKMLVRKSMDIALEEPFGQQEKRAGGVIERALRVENHVGGVLVLRLRNMESGVFEAMSPPEVEIPARSTVRLPIRVGERWDGSSSQTGSFGYVARMGGVEVWGQVDVAVHPLLRYRAEPNAVILMPGADGDTKRVIRIIDRRSRPVQVMKIESEDESAVGVRKSGEGELELTIHTAGWGESSRKDVKIQCGDGETAEMIRVPVVLVGRGPSGSGDRKGVASGG